MHEHAYFFALLVLTLGAASGCGGTETGNPTLPASELRLAALSDDFGSVAVGTPGPGLTVNHAYVALERIELLPCGAGNPLRFEATEVDLAQRPAVLLRVQGAASEYCSARVSLAPVSNAETPELEGGSVTTEGTRPDGVPFEIRSALSLEVELTTDPPETPFDARRLILGFNLVPWLADVDVAGAAVADGLATIDATHNATELATFEAQAPLAPALYDDADGNGLLAGDNQPPTASP